MVATTAIKGDSTKMTLSKNAYTKENNYFMGWATSAEDAANKIVTYSDNQEIDVPAENQTLSGDQSHQIDQTDALYALVLGKLSKEMPATGTAVYEDCKNSHSIAACGALIARTQQENWTPKLEEKSLMPLLSLETLFGFLFFPVAFLMGVPLSDCYLVGQLLGEKMAVNEFVAYLHLSQVVDQLSYRGIVISTGMAPNRRSDIAKLGIKAMIGGSIAAFMTATIAGALI